MFVDFYIIHENGAQAVRDAGYNTKWPDRLANQILESSGVKEAIKSRKIEIRKLEDAAILEKISTRAELQRERNRIARFDVGKTMDSAGNLLPLHLMDEDTRCAIQSIEVKESFTDPETGITTQIKKITAASKITAIDRLDEYLEKRERDLMEDGAIPKDATIIENGLQITNDYNQDIPDEDLMPESLRGTDA